MFYNRMQSLKTFIKKYKKTIFLFLSITFISVILLSLPVFVIIRNGRLATYKSVDDAEPTDVAIVFGAGIVVNAYPSPMLQDRLETSAKLYENGKVKKLIVSGDNRFDNYNEPDVMKRYLINNTNVKAEDIITDYAGRRTYDTCARAKNIFGVDKAILVTQGFHIPRAVYLCKHAGVESSAVSATRPSGYLTENILKLREVLAIYKALIDVHIKPPSYVGGEKIDIWGPPLNRCENFSEEECEADTKCLPVYVSSHCFGSTCTQDRIFMSCKEIQEEESSK